MQKANKWRNVVFPLAALLIVVADQLSKIWIRTNLAVGQSLPESGFPRLIHITNTGAGFGLLQGQSFALTIVAIVSIVALLVYAVFLYRRFPFLNNRLAWLGLGLILGGVTGNLIDRLRFGSVTDFIDFGFWPAFNVSDSAIVVGVFIFAYTLISLARIVKD